MHEPEMRTLPASPGNNGVLPARDRRADSGGHDSVQHQGAGPKRKQFAFSVRRLLTEDQPTPEGEPATAPLPAVDYSAAPATPVRKPWPVLLAQAMRTGRYVNAQQALVGAVDCRVPDPDTLLTIGGRWQGTHKRLRAARNALSPEQQQLIRAYLERDDNCVPRQDEDHRTYYVAVPPEMRDGEPEAFGALWRALHAQGVLDRLPPRPPTDDQEST